MTRAEWEALRRAASAAELMALKTPSGSQKQAQFLWGTPERIRLEYGAEPRKRGLPIVEHESVVRKALAEGKPVPAEVLAEYPDLAAPKPTATQWRA
jgi:hypothetical protein